MWDQRQRDGRPRVVTLKPIDRDNMRGILLRFFSEATGFRRYCHLAIHQRANPVMSLARTCPSAQVRDCGHAQVLCAGISFIQLILILPMQNVQAYYKNVLFVFLFYLLARLQRNQEYFTYKMTSLIMVRENRTEPS